MAKFSIIPKGGGTARYSGCPSFTGTYMKPGVLEFREIAVPSPIAWEVGDYVEYTRTGRTYRLYTVPQVKKQARSTEYGGAFVYQSVQFFDDSKQLEICPFRDLVPDDNRIHFSTQPAIAVFDNVAGIAERLQTCLVDMYGANSWVVRVATVGGDGISQDLADLMAEDRDFSVSGVNILQCLDKIYEVWPEVGWVYKIENGTNTIVIGGAGLNTPDSYQYGKGNGLRTITRNVANADELATRIFAYGSSRNMLPRWYNNQTIKDADSVDIQNLMLPVNAVGTQGQAGYYPGWGKTNVQGTDLPDPAKAYIDADDAAMTRLGLRPKTYYFDGSGDLPDIYPTIRKMTVKNVRDALGSSSAQYYPSTSVYTNENQRVDTVLSAPLSFDSGLAGSGGGKETIFTDYKNSTASDSESVSGDVKIYTRSIFTESFSLGSSVAGTRDLSFAIDLSGTVQVTGIKGAKVTAYLRKGHPANSAIISREMKLEESTTAGTYIFVPFTLTGSRKVVEEATYYLVIDLEVELDASSSARTLAYDAVASISASVQNYRETTFKIGIRQIGFDINEQANLGEGKTIAMRSGKCAGRSFVIKNCTYVSATDSWSLDVIRSEDESLSQWFPNSDYPILAGDEFVLLDIAMPDEYILVAERNLLAAAQELLADVSVERWQYTPEIDAKFMVENSRSLLPGENISLSDTDVVGNSAVSILIDSVTISEGEAAIPTYKVTLRDRKRKTFTESKGADSISSNPVTKSSSQVAKEASAAPSVVSDSYFTLDENGNVTLKEQYQNLWVPGWLADGGIGTGGGGGGGSSVLYGLSDVSIPQPPSTPNLNDVLAYSDTLGKWTNVGRSTFLSGYATSSELTSGLAGKQDAYPFTITGQNGETYDLSNLGVSVDNKNADIGTSLTTIATVGGVDIKAKITHQSLSGYVPTSRTVNGKPLSSDVSIGFSDLSSTPNTLSGYGITDAKIENGTITLGSNSITPLTSHQSVTLASGTSNGTLKITTAAGTVDNIAVTGLGSLAFLSDISGTYVTLATQQTISGAKTFSADLTASSDIILSTNNKGLKGKDASANTRNIAKINGSNYLEIGDSNLSRVSVTAGGQIWMYWGSYNDGEYICGGSGAFLYTPNLLPNGTRSVGSTTQRWSKLWAVDTDLSGNLSLSSSSHIDLGPIRFEYYNTGDANALHITSNDGSTVNMFVDGWIADGGIGSGSGSGGASVLSGLNDVTITSPAQDNVLVYDYSLSHWVNVSKASFLSGYATTASLATVATSGSYNDLSNKPSIPDESTVSGWGFTKNAGTVTSVAMTVPTGLSVSGSPITSNGTLAVTFASGYSIPTTTKQGNWDTAYSTVSGSQSKNKVFASPSNATGAPSFRALVAADIPELGAGKITSGTLDFARLPSIYIGRNAATSSAGDVTLLGITGFTTASSASASGDTSLVVWEPNGGGTGVGVWHFKGNIVADGWIADGGIGSSSSGGVDLARVWESLTNNTDEPNVKINIAHIPTIPTTNITGLATVATSGSYNDLTNLPTIPSAPGTLNTNNSTAQSVNSSEALSGTVKLHKIAKTGTFSDLLSIPTTVDGYGITDAVKTSGNQSISGNKTFTGAILASSIQERSAQYPLSIGSPHGATVSLLADTTIYDVTLRGVKEVSGTPTEKWYIEETGAASFASVSTTSLKVNGTSVTPANYVTLDGTQTITGNKTFASGITFGGNIIPSTDLGASLGYSTQRISDANIRTLTISEVNLRDNNNTVKTGYFTAKTGALAFFVETSASGIDLGDAATYKKYTFDSGCFCPAQSGTNLGYNNSTSRWNNYYGVNADLSGNLSMAQTSQITLGPVTITYDATNKALHISGTDNGQTIGIYCDGWIADGGIQQTS